ncbi:hypothetical protein HK100_008752, partial [Physocladia obscura]
MRLMLTTGLVHLAVAVALGCLVHKAILVPGRRNQLAELGPQRQSKTIASVQTIHETISESTVRQSQSFIRCTAQSVLSLLFDMPVFPSTLRQSPTQQKQQQSVSDQHQDTPACFFCFSRERIYSSQAESQTQAVLLFAFLSWPLVLLTLGEALYSFPAGRAVMPNRGKYTTYIAARVMRNLPVATFASVKSAAGDCGGDAKHLSSSCSICLDSYHDKDALRKMPCGHWYHCDCID